MTVPTRLVAALLAAGSSQRFGAGNKLMAMWQGQPLITYAAAALRGVPAHRYIAVCPPDDTALHDVLKTSGFEICINQNAREGLSASVRLAARAAIDDNADALLIALGDMPNVPASHFAALISGVPANGTTASRVDGGDTNMPPACFGKDAIPALLNITGDKGARDIITKAAPVMAQADQVRDFDIAADFE
jgi:CTP:molybdopterin cytidylyltransferase MocA